MANLSALTFVQGEAEAKAYSQGQSVLVLEFWATWCPPCRETIPHLSHLHTKYKDKNVLSPCFQVFAIFMNKLFPPPLSSSVLDATSPLCPRSLPLKVLLLLTCYSLLLTRLLPSFPLTRLFVRSELSLFI